MAVEVNQRGFEHAKHLIREGRAVADERGDWRDHRPDAHTEDAHMLAMGAERYGNWHLGIDHDEPEGLKPATTSCSATSPTSTTAPCSRSRMPPKLPLR